MGRGLSELQKTILIIGHRNRGKGDDPLDTFGRGLADVTITDVLKEYFGWGFDEAWAGKDSHRQWAYERYKRRGGLPFSRKIIGEKRYAAAYASIARAMQRLHDRGLITHHKHRGAELSPWGMHQAHRLRTGRQPTLLTVNRDTAENVNAFNEERRQGTYARLMESLGIG